MQVKRRSSVGLLVALLKAQVSLQLGNVSSSDNGVSLSIMYSYTYIAYFFWRASFKILNAYLMIAKCFCTYSEHIIYIWALISKASLLEHTDGTPWPISGNWYANHFLRGCRNSWHKVKFCK